MSLLGSVAQVSADPAEPAWLAIARAGRLMDQGEFGGAIRTFRRALDLSPENPMALYGLGRAYRAVGDLDVAEDYFRRSLDHQERFEVADTRLLVRYEIAALHRIRRDFARYEHELMRLVEDDPATDELADVNPQRALAEHGLDRFLVLYRLTESGGTVARGMLAELLVGLGRYYAATGHATVAVLQSMTTVIEAVIRRDPTFEFSTVIDVMTHAARHPEIREYVEDSRLFRDLYYLAASLWGERDRGAFEVWRVLSEIDRDGAWGERARRQLADPQPEPLLVPTR